ncbi:hypothetical protein [Roseisolibacter sp. H3M3-2]|uniref:hypothetical protein n=1 Tax=Roseisolibacter sp. H3M3-2 TaxID=3031323 RepID=UPI0023DCB9D1|nr:hypothetical protein [Roseisolibacter sp. H3M3-2]MDF1502372.1 hypothetical protein [Roseisolibacter sp. H3M3-2]
MGFAWAIGGIGVAGILETLDNVSATFHPVTRLVDMWPQTLAVVGFVAGVLFAVILGVAARNRRFEQFTFPQFAGLGALAGAVVSVLALLTGAPLAIPVILTLAGTLGGAGSLLVARVAERRGLLAGGTDRQLLDRGD